MTLPYFQKHRTVSLPSQNVRSKKVRASWLSSSPYAQITQSTQPSLPLLTSTPSFTHARLPLGVACPDPGTPALGSLSTHAPSGQGPCSLPGSLPSPGSFPSCLPFILQPETKCHCSAYIMTHFHMSRLSLARNHFSCRLPTLLAKHSQVLFGSYRVPVLSTDPRTPTQSSPC